VQVDPIRPTLKAPVSSLLNLRYDGSLSNFAFNFNLRRSTEMMEHSFYQLLNLGEAVHVDPIKPKLKPPGRKRLKLDHDGLLSNFGFKFNLRRYTSLRSCTSTPCGARRRCGQGLTLVHFSAQPEPFLTQKKLNTP